MDGTMVRYVNIVVPWFRGFYNHTSLTITPLSTVTCGRVACHRTMAGRVDQRLSYAAAIAMAMPSCRDRSPRFASGTMDAKLLGNFDICHSVQNATHLHE